MKGRKKIPAILLVVALAVTSICNVNCRIVAEAATKPVKIGNGMYTITSEGKKEARFDKASKKSVKSLTIPATVRIGNKYYKIVSIKSGALKDNKKLKSLVIGENVKTIGKKAFYNCKNLKSITIKTQVLKSVGSNAFGKIYSKAVATMPKMTDEKEKKYAIDMLDGKGKLLDRNQTLKVKNFAGIPDPEIRFAIGELESGVRDFWKNTSTDAAYNVGDSMKFTMWVEPPLEMYGEWSVKRKKVMQNKENCICQKYFDACTEDLAVHIGQSGHGAIGYTRYWLYGKEKMDMWYWKQYDNIPCKVVYHATLPEGLTVNPDSVEVWRQANKPISQADGKYDIQVSGQDVTVTINNIKPVPYRLSNDGPIFGVVVKFSAQLEETAADVNQVNADISYSFGKINKTLNMNPVTIRKN